MKKPLLIALGCILFVAAAWPATIVVEMPAGGEKWRQKEVRSISWKSEGLTGQLRITLWRDEALLGEIAPAVSPDQDMFLWAVGQHKGGWAPAGGGYKIKVKQKGTNIFGMSVRPFEILKEEEETDLSLGGCVMRDRAGQAVTQWRRGDIAKVEFRVKVPSDLPCFKFSVKAWSVHGQPSSTRHSLMGKSHAEQLYIFTPPWTEKTGFFYLKLNEERDGPFTLLLEVTAVVPKKDINPRNNRCGVPFAIGLKSQAGAEVKGENAVFRRPEFRPNLKVSLYSQAPDGDDFNVLIVNENYRIAKINKPILVYLLYDIYRNWGKGFVNFETFNLRGDLLESLNRFGQLGIGFFSRGWIDAGAKTCTVTVDNRNDVAESNEEDNQCTIHF